MINWDICGHISARTILINACKASAVKTLLRRNALVKVQQKLLRCAPRICIRHAKTKPNLT